jgi:hypothetical protein
MVGQLGQASDTEPASGDGTAGADADAGASAGADAEVAAGAAVAEDRAGAEDRADAEDGDERPALRIDSVVIIDAAGRADVAAGDAVAAGPPIELVAPARVAFTVSGARPKTRLWAVARLLRSDGPGRNARDPVEVPDSGNVEFDLSAAPAGQYDVSLIAWAPDATAKPVSVRLPATTIRAG